MTETHAPAQPGAKAYTPGVFVWHEYVSNDKEKAIAFYEALFGWEVERKSMEGHDYPEIVANGKHIGGFQTMGDVPHAHWYGYVSVADVDKATAAAVEAGGKAFVGPMSFPGVGRFTVLADPHGAVFALFKSEHGDPDTTGMPGLGEIMWDSLNATDVPGATAFYAKAVGWGIGEDPQGSGGVFMAGESMEASFNPAPAGVPASWLIHVTVADLAAARAKVEQLGGKVLMPEIAIAYGKYAVCADPLGAAFAVFQGAEG